MRFVARFFVALFFVATCLLVLAMVRDWGRDRLDTLRAEFLCTARLLVVFFTFRADDPAFLLETSLPWAVLPLVYWPLRRFFAALERRAGFSQTAPERSYPVARGRTEDPLLGMCI